MKKGIFNILLKFIMQSSNPSQIGNVILQLELVLYSGDPKTDHSKSGHF